MDENETKHTAVMYLHSPDSDDVNITHNIWLDGNFSSASLLFIALCCLSLSLALCFSLSTG